VGWIIGVVEYEVKYFIGGRVAHAFELGGWDRLLNWVAQGEEKRN